MLTQNKCNLEADLQRQKRNMSTRQFGDVKGIKYAYSLSLSQSE